MQIPFVNDLNQPRLCTADRAATNLFFYGMTVRTFERS
jgi:hypothetical protein